MAFLRSKIFAALLGSLLFLVAMALVIPKGIGQAPPATEDGQEAHPTKPANTRGPSWDFFNPEMDQIVSELKMEREALGAKEKRLTEWETRLQAERAELDEATKTIGQFRQQVDRELLRIKDDEAVNLKRLAKMYSSMEPGGAVQILKELDDTVVVKIMTLMKDAETGLILNALARLGEAETKRAAKISETLRLNVATKANPKP